MINKTKTLFFFLLKIIIKYITKNNNSLNEYMLSVDILFYILHSYMCGEI